MQSPFTKIVLKTKVATVDTPFNHFHWCNLMNEMAKILTSSKLQAHRGQANDDLPIATNKSAGVYLPGRSLFKYQTNTSP